MKRKEKLLKWLSKALKKEEKIKKFRLSGMHLFLTYAQMDQEREKVLDQLEKKVQIEKYVIGSEKHEDGQNHIHVYLKLKKRCNIYSAKTLDIFDKSEQQKHGKYETCRSYSRVINYVVKGGMENVLTNMDLDDTGREKDIWWDMYNELKNDGEISEIMEKIAKISSKSFLWDSPRLRKSLIEIKNRHKEKKVNYYPLKSFELPAELQEYKEKEMFTKALFLRGDTGVGKTEVVKSIYNSIDGPGEVVRITDKQDLGQLNETDCKAVIIDDMSAEEWQGEKVLNLLDLANDNTQRILYNFVRLPAGTPRAWITNKYIHEIFEGLSPKQYEALMRRVRSIDVGNKKLIIRLEKKTTMEIELSNERDVEEVGKKEESQEKAEKEPVKRKRGRPKKEKN